MNNIMICDLRNDIHQLTTADETIEPIDGLVDCVSVCISLLEESIRGFYCGRERSTFLILQPASPSPDLPPASS
jgi:hypothetical protein